MAAFGSWKCQYTFLSEDKMQRGKSQKEEASLNATAHFESSVLKMTSCGLKVANISAVLERTLKNQSLKMSLHRGREGQLSTKSSLMLNRYLSLCISAARKLLWPSHFRLA